MRHPNTPVTRLATIAFVAAAAAVHVARYSSPTASVVAAVLALGLARAALPREPRLGHLIVLFGTGTLLFAAGADAVPLDEPFAAFSAQSGHQNVMLGVRIALLWVVLGAPREDRRERVTPTISVLVVALFVASLAAVALVIPFVVSCLVITGRHPTDPLGLTLTSPLESRPAARWISLVSLATMLAAAAVVLPRRAPPTEPPAVNAAAETVQWLARDNPFRARYAAATWAAAERPQKGSGTVLVAELDWTLGHHERARREIRDALERSASPDVTARAEHLVTEWARSDPDAR